jgi:gamma-glutamyl-gamma-aminobutyrate hydrolase PuuD
MNLAACKLGTGMFFPFDNMGLFNDSKVVNNPDDLTSDDCLVVWGGADISPSLYGKKASRYCHADEQPSYRDAYEWACMQRAKELKIPIIGVCRGAQMLCALAGGHLIQHVDNHGSHHSVVTNDGLELKVNSLHHQMMYPWNVNHVLVAWSKDARSGVYYDENNLVNVPCEPEFVHFPDVRGAAIQWHPEFMSGDAEATHYLANWLKENLL